jgi:hypothetical protein
MKSTEILEAARVTAAPELDGDIILELESTLRTPPTALPGGDVLAVVFSARVMKASSVFPEEGALIAPTMPVNIL